MDVYVITKARVPFDTDLVETRDVAALYPEGEWSGFDLRRPEPGSGRAPDEVPDEAYLVSTETRIDVDCVPWTTGLIVSQEFLDLLGEHILPPFTLVPCVPYEAETTKTYSYLTSVEPVDCVEVAASVYTVSDGAGGYRVPSAEERAEIEADRARLILDTKTWSHVEIREGCIETGLFRLENIPARSRYLCTDELARSLRASGLAGFGLTPLNEYLRELAFA